MPGRGWNSDMLTGRKFIILLIIGKNLEQKAQNSQILLRFGLLVQDFSFSLIYMVEFVMCDL